jgi:hypothetical protein
MALDSSTRSSRRAILAAAAGAAAATVVTAARPLSVRGAGNDGAIIHIGDTYADAQAQTTLGNKANNGIVLWVASNSDSGFGGGTAVVGFSHHGIGLNGQSNNTGTGVKGQSSSGFGVNGESTSSYGVYGHSFSGYGVVGNSGQKTAMYGYSAASGEPATVGQSGGNNTGVLGFSGADLPVAKAKTGVYGYAAQDGGSKGVWGASSNGVGLYGQATSGFALRTSGRLKADKVSGVASIGAGKTSVIVTPGVNVTTGSFVLLTPKVSLGGRDLWFTTDATHNRLTIHISSSRSSVTKVAWLLMG